MLNGIRTLAFAGLTAAILAMPATALAKKQEEESTLPEAVQQLHTLYGKWKGSVQLTRKDQPLLALNMEWWCKTGTGGWAITCTADAVSVGKEPPVGFERADLFGFDPLTGTTHWYAVTNMGETHDHKVEWPDPKTLKAHTSWEKDGLPYEENISINFIGSDTISIRSTVTSGDETLMELIGNLKR